MADKKLVLETSGLGIAFGGLKAVSDLSIKIYEGELIGLIGPNGAGKTTVFNLLTGIYTPTEGDVFLLGKSLKGVKPYKIVESGIARTFQNIRLFKTMTVLENVKIAMTGRYKYGFFSALFRLPSYWREERDKEKKAIELLEICGLDDIKDHVASSLPYGKQRKLEIARALATGMKLLLLDEPAAGLNPTETIGLLDCIRAIREKFNIAILLIEHDMSLVMNITERIYVINFGKCIASGTPFEIAHSEEVIEAYLGKEERG